MRYKLFQQAVNFGKVSKFLYIELLVILKNGLNNS